MCEVTCEVKREVKVTFQVNSCGTNELEKYIKCVVQRHIFVQKYKKRVVQRHIFVQGTLTIDQNQSPTLPQRWTASKRAGCPAGRPVFFLSRPRPNVGRLRRPGAVRVQSWRSIQITFRVHGFTINTRAQMFKARLRLSWICGNFDCYLFTVKGGFFHKIEMKGKEICNL